MLSTSHTQHSRHTAARWNRNNIYKQCTQFGACHEIGLTIRMNKTMNFSRKSKQYTLENVTIAKITDWIVSQAHAVSQSDSINSEESLTRHIENIRNHLKNKIPKKFHNKLAAAVIKRLTELSYVERRRVSDETDIAKNVRVIGRLIETLFTENLTRLRFEQGIEIFEASLTSSSRLLGNLTDLQYNGTVMLDDDTLGFYASLDDDTLQTLLSSERHISSKHNDLKYNGVTVHYDTLFIRLLKELHSLKYLTINNYNQSLNNILICLTDNCSLLEELNLNSSESIDDESVNILIRLPNLKSVDLGSTETSELGIAKLLLSCPNIEHITAWGLESAVEHIAGKQFQLKSFYSCLGATLEQRQLVVKMCPLIQKMTLTKEHITVLYDLQNLNDLELNFFQFYEDGIKEFLEVKGSNLKHLSLENIVQLDLDAIASIYLSCPNLESFKMTECSFEAVGVLHKEIFYSENPVFGNLNRSSLHTLDWLLTDDQLLYLLSSDIKVEFVKEDEQYIFTDESSMPPHRLFHLKEFTLCFCESKLLVHRMIQNCMKPLEVVIFEMYRY